MNDQRFGGDIQEGKRELIKLGLDQGYLTREDFSAHLPLEHMSDSELEMLRFTLETLGIDVKEDQPQE